MLYYQSRIAAGDKQGIFQSVIQKSRPYRNQGLESMLIRQLAESAQALLDQLFTCDLPYCTPDGRPTLVQYSSAELRRRFGKSH